MAANDQSVRHLFDAEAEAASESTRFINSPSPTDKDHPAEKSATASSSSSKRTLAFTLVAGLAVSNALSLAVGAYAGRHRALMQQSLDTHCAAHTVQYSPLLDEVTIQYAPVTFNGSFLQETVYRRPAAPEVDAAWEALGVNYRAGVIPAAAGPRSGLTPDHVQRADRYGGGFLVNVEGMHHLHCLVSLYFSFSPSDCRSVKRLLTNVPVSAWLFAEPRPPVPLLQLPILQGHGQACLPKQRRHSPKTRQSLYRHFAAGPHV